MDKEKIRIYQKEHAKKRRQERIAAGRCVQCNEPVMDGRLYCAEHVLYHKNNSAKADKDIKNKYANNYKKRKYQERREKGLCIRCDNATDGVLVCSQCRDKASQSRRDLWYSRVQNGKCKHCGKNDLNHEKSSVCSDCFFKQTLKNVKNHRNGTVVPDDMISIISVLFDEQQGICPYTGIKMDLGVSASLDHKIPLSRGGTNQKCNLQWVYCGSFDVNRMKSDMLDCEFKQAIKKLLYCLGDK
jgi:hypothetical protein